MNFQVLFALVLAVSINAEYPGNIEGPKRLDDRIAVVGGGFSAVHMTLLMKKRGFRNINILVEGNGLGGDEVQSVVHRGTLHEMGKHMFIPAMLSKDIDDFMTQYNQGVLTELPSPTVWTQDTNNRHVGNQLNDYLMGLARQQFGQSLSDEQVKNTIMRKISEFNSTIRSLLPAWEEVPAQPSWSQKFLLAGSFRDFLVDRGHESMLPIANYLFGMMGYGRAEDYPAYYGLFFFKSGLLTSINKRLQNNAGLRGMPGYKINSRGMKHLLDAITQREVMNVTLNARIDDIMIYGTDNWNRKHHINMNVNGVQKTGVYDFVIFADCLRKYVKLNRGRTRKEYQMFLRPGTKYIVKTLVDSLNVPRGSSPFNYYADSFNRGQSTDYKITYSVDSFAAYQGHSGSLYQTNQLRNSNDQNDGTRRTLNSVVFTQMSSRKPNVGTANTYLLSYLRARGGTNMTIVQTTTYGFFPHYMDRDLTNGMMYEILKLQGARGIWYIGKSAYLDNIAAMIGYNKMLVNKFRM